MLYNNKEVNLSTGQIAKNYKEMCKILGEDIKCGNSKKAQIKNWKRYFDFAKDGQKLIILEIYNEPLEKPEIHRTREGVYVQYIECLLMDMLAQSPNHKIVSTKVNLYVTLGMANENYARFYDVVDKSKLVEEINNSNDYKSSKKQDTMISKFDVISFYRYSSLELDRILLRSLISMKNRKLIDYKTSHIIEFTDNNDRYKNCSIGHLATVDEENKILDIEKRMVTEMRYNSLQEIVCSGKIPLYRKLVNRGIREYCPEWKRVSPVLCIVYNENKDEHRPLVAEDIRNLTSEQQKKELNKKVHERLNQVAQKEYENNRMCYEEYMANKS